MHGMKLVLWARSCLAMRIGLYLSRVPKAAAYKTEKYHSFQSGGAETGRLAVESDYQITRR